MMIKFRSCRVKRAPKYFKINTKRREIGCLIFKLEVIKGESKQLHQSKGSKKG